MKNFAATFAYMQNLLVRCGVDPKLNLNDPAEWWHQLFAVTRRLHHDDKKVQRWTMREICNVLELEARDREAAERRARAREHRPRRKALRHGAVLKNWKAEADLTWNTIARESRVSVRYLILISNGGAKPSDAMWLKLGKYFARVLAPKTNF